MAAKLKCKCPMRCEYCGRARSRDNVGHFCRTPNCQWAAGYQGCRPVSKPKPDLRPGLLAAARMARRLSKDQGLATMLPLMKSGYQSACREIADLCARRARKGQKSP